MINAMLSKVVMESGLPRADVLQLEPMGSTEKCPNNLWFTAIVFFWKNSS